MFTLIRGLAFRDQRILTAVIIIAAIKILAAGGLVLLVCGWPGGYPGRLGSCLHWQGRGMGRAALYLAAALIRGWTSKNRGKYWWNK